MEELTYAVAGWLAGLFSAVIFEVIQRRRLRVSLRQALKWELEEFRYGLATDAFWLVTFAKLDRDDEHFGWIAEVHATLSGVN